MSLGVRVGVRMSASDLDLEKSVTIQLCFFVNTHMHATLKAMGVLTILVLCRLYQSYMVLCIFGSLRWRCLHIIMYTMEKGLFPSIFAL